MKFSLIWFISACFFQFDFFHPGRIARFLPSPSQSEFFYLLGDLVGLLYFYFSRLVVLWCPAGSFYPLGNLVGLLYLYLSRLVALLSAGPAGYFYLLKIFFYQLIQYLFKPLTNQRNIIGLNLGVSFRAFPSGPGDMSAQATSSHECSNTASINHLVMRELMSVHAFEKRRT